MCPTNTPSTLIERVIVRLAIGGAIQSNNQLNDEVDTISQPFFVSLWQPDIPRHTTVLLDGVWNVPTSMVHVYPTITASIDRRP